MSARYTKRAGGRGACAPHPAHLCTAPAADALQHPLSIAPPSARISQVLRHQRLPPQQHHLAQQDWCSVEEPKAVDQTEGDFRSALFGMLSNDADAFYQLRILVHSLLCNAFQCKNAHDNTDIAFANGLLSYAYLLYALMPVSTGTKHHPLSTAPPSARLSQDDHHQQRLQRQHSPAC